MTLPRASTLVPLFALALLFTGTYASAATFDVAPGPGTPVQDAIDAASPGDTIRLAGGGYPEAVVITKALHLYGPAGTYLDANPQPAVIEAGCTGSTTGITVAANDVVIRDLRVIEFTDYGIDVQGRDKVKLQNVLTLPNCLGDTPLAGVHVAASTRVKLESGWIDALTDPGAPAIHLSALAERANVRLHRTVAGGHAVGILVDGCAPRSVQISRSYANFNLETGILLQNSDGILVKHCQVQFNSTNGIAVDAASDGNRLIANDVGGSATDVSDAGTGNCWTKNTFTTGGVPGCP